jgi:hypothetical protein
VKKTTFKAESSLHLEETKPTLALRMLLLKHCPSPSVFVQGYFTLSGKGKPSLIHAEEELFKESPGVFKRIAGLVLRKTLTPALDLPVRLSTPSCIKEEFFLALS